ncbi:MAG: flagellar hook-basal body protein [Fimbriimonadales bacterium]
MNRGIYAASAGMSMLRRQLDVVANNLANVSTTGYKKDVLAFNDVMAKALQNGEQPIGSLGYGPQNFLEVTEFEVPGEILPTGNPLDLAIDGNKGAFAVRSLKDGTVRYTRDGSFTRNPDGKLVTKAGDLVLDDRMNEIDLPAGKAVVANDGTLSVNGSEVAKIGVFEGSFRKVGGNLFEGNATAMDEATVHPNALEQSNVSAIESMVQMIDLQRSFEIAQRSITAQDELAQRLISSLQDR